MMVSKNGMLQVEKNPYDALVIGLPPDQIRREDLINFHNHEMKILRALPDQSLVEVSVVGGGLRTYYMNKGKAHKLRAEQEWFERSLALCKF